MHSRASLETGKRIKEKKVGGARRRQGIIKKRQDTRGKRQATTPPDFSRFLVVG